MFSYHFLPSKHASDFLGKNGVTADSAKSEVLPYDQWVKAWHVKVGAAAPNATHRGFPGWQ